MLASSGYVEIVEVLGWWDIDPNSDVVFIDRKFLAKMIVPLIEEVIYIAALLQQIGIGNVSLLFRIGLNSFFFF